MNDLASINKSIVRNFESGRLKENTDEDCPDGAAFVGICGMARVSDELEQMELVGEFHAR